MALLLGSPPAAWSSSDRARFPDRTAVLVGVGGGAMRVDLPDPNHPGESFGTRPRLCFDLGYEANPWLEVGADVALAMLGESDSLNAILRQGGSKEVAPFTLVQAALDVRARWIAGNGRWAPYARAGAGVSALSLSAPGALGRRDRDPAWNLGGGVEFYARRRIVLRAEGLYVGQAAQGGTRHHAVAGLTLLYALPRAAFGESPP